MTVTLAQAVLFLVAMYAMLAFRHVIFDRPSCPGCGKRFEHSKNCHFR